ncbi:MAG: hypothetical protein AMXMBFR7_25160 [Planctomycetota bacterium]
MAQEGGAERRQYKRVTLDLPVFYRFRTSDPRLKIEKLTYQGMTRNLSEGGLLMLGPLPDLAWISPLLMSKILLDMTLELPGAARSIAVEGRAAWVEAKPSGLQDAMYGITFGTVARESKEALRAWIDERGT